MHMFLKRLSHFDYNTNNCKLDVDGGEEEKRWMQLAGCQQVVDSADSLTRKLATDRVGGVNICSDNTTSTTTVPVQDIARHEGSRKYIGLCLWETNDGARSLSSLSS